MLEVYFAVKTFVYDNFVYTKTQTRNVFKVLFSSIERESGILSFYAYCFLESSQHIE